MKFTLSWLKDHLETEASLAEITETLTRIGLEVEAVDDPGAKLAAFTIAYVVSAEQHPNADRLRVCMVDTGEGAPVQVVCGAPNARTGMKSVFSPPGTYIPGKDITLGVGTIRGVESRGMLCSAAELQISEDHDGIIDLPADAPVGARYVDWAHLSDPVIEINLTPNRPDCTSIHGIARDLAAAGLGKLKTDVIQPVKGAFPNPQKVSLAFAQGEEKYCPAFALRLVRGVKNGPSPEWMQRRLKAIGLRPINALVDVTNYVTFDRGRPLHVFDAKKVKGALVVRRSQAGETVLGLDGRVYGFTGNETVIADDNGVESIAGVMGGEHSGCDEGTTDVLIESALWDPMDIARTGRSLGIVTDARYRFERGVDPNFTLSGVELATRLVMDMCGGEPSEVTLEGAIPDTGFVINFPLNETKRLTGLEVSDREQKRILEHLGFDVSGNGPMIKVSPPSWRPDVHGKADIAEEVMRIAGVDRVPSTPLDRGGTVPKPVLTLIQKRTRIAKRTLAGRGMVEAVTWSFISKAQASCSAAASRRWRSPIPSPPISRTCGRPCSSALPPPPSAMPIAAMATWRCSRSVRCSRATAPRTSSSPRRACAVASPSPLAPVATGRVRLRLTSTTSRLTRWRCSPPPARRWPASRWCRAVRPGSIPAAPARSRWVRRRCSAPSASCIRGCWKPST